MITYWLLFMLPVGAAVAPVQPGIALKRIANICIFILLVAVIGGRDEIGCDWSHYDDQFFDSQFNEALATGDIAYVLLNRAFYTLGFQVYAVNIVCGAVFAFGLVSFCSRQPNSPLALALATPYLVTVVAMGYTRQATALGFLMLAFNAFQDRKLRLYLSLVLIAATFHKTAVVFGLLALFIDPNRKFSAGLIGLSITALMVFFLLLDSLDGFMYGYVESAMASDGGAYRIAGAVCASTVVLLLRRRWALLYTDARFFLVLSILPLICAIVFPSAPAATDRLNAYFLPFQIAVSARAPEFFRGTIWYLPVLAAITILYAGTLYVWLHYASHAYCWVPYKSVFF